MRKWEAMRPTENVTVLKKPFEDAKALYNIDKFEMLQQPDEADSDKNTNIVNVTALMNLESDDVEELEYPEDAADDLDELFEVDDDAAEDDVEELKFADISKDFAAIQDLEDDEAIEVEDVQELDVTPEEPANNDFSQLYAEAFGEQKDDDVQELKFADISKDFAAIQDLADDEATQVEDIQNLGFKWDAFAGDDDIQDLDDD